MKNLWYKKPANDFIEALPLGSGRLGCMHYADPINDKLTLNEDTLWSGYPKDKSPENGFEGVQKAKKLLNEGKINQAEKAIWKESLGKWSEAYQPAGALNIICNDGEEYTDYYRELDLNTAISKTTYKINGFDYKREVFCSHPDNVIIYRFTTNAKESEVNVFFTTPHPFRQADTDAVLAIKSIMPSYSAPNYFKCDNPIVYDDFENNRAISYCAAVKPVLLQGDYSIDDGKIKINSTDFFLILNIESNFEAFNKQPSESTKDYFGICLDIISSAAQKKYDELRESHIKDYQAFFNRMELCIGGNNREDLPTDERIMQYQKDSSDNGLAVLLFDYGRYLTIASSREKTQATNLQGIWNESVRPPWSSNYTLNINTEMNYWHVESVNLSECHLPLIDFINELSVNGAATARKNYNCGGWCSHHNSDLWRHSESVGGETDHHSVVYGFWNMSGAWLVRHIWEHYEYTLDKEFLRNNIEVIRGAVEFLLDWLEKDDENTYITPLATSPENRYNENDQKACAISKGSAMDTAITLDLFEIYLNAAKVLDFDEEFCKKINEYKSQLKGYVIGNKGQILEWNKEVEECEPHHRHLSPLYGLYPGHSINDKTPDLSKAAEITMNNRGDEATGWGITWKICVWARLGNGERAKNAVDKMLRPVGNDGNGGVHMNLLDSCPPFQIDGNFGYTAGISQMLVQEKENEVLLIPALPKAWSDSGSVRGMKLKGNLTIDFKWENGIITEKRIY